MCLCFPQAMTQVDEQVKIKLISQFIESISRVLQKLFKYFNDTAISAFIIPRLVVLTKNLALNLNELESVMRFFGSS